MSGKVNKSLDKIRNECDTIEDEVEPREPKPRKGNIFGDPIAMVE